MKKTESQADPKMKMRLQLDEIEDRQVDTERSEGFGRRDANMSQEKKPSLLQQAFPALLSPKLQAEPKV